MLLARTKPRTLAWSSPPPTPTTNFLRTRLYAPASAAYLSFHQSRPTCSACPAPAGGSCASLPARNRARSPQRGRAACPDRFAGREFQDDRAQTPPSPGRNQVVSAHLLKPTRPLRPRSSRRTETRMIRRRVLYECPCQQYVVPGLLRCNRISTNCPSNLHDPLESRISNCLLL